MEILWILFKVTDKEAFNLIAKSTTKINAGYGMYSIVGKTYHYMYELDPSDPNEIYVGTIDKAIEVVTLINIGIDPKEIREMYTWQDT